jgi:hypothetical protein
MTDPIPHSQRDLEANRLGPWGENPMYWQYAGEPVLLLGGSLEDNLFQIDQLESHLDAIAACGGNYVRCTMSSRDPGDVWPFELDESTGLYDLDRPGREYWRRFDRFCRLTAERKIFAQIELWDRFDFAREPWLSNPFNPARNVNYTCAESGLAENYDQHPSLKQNGFFRSVPAVENNQVLLRYQQAHVDKLLEVSLRYDHLLYCMDNETNEAPDWPAYWAGYLRDKAAQAGRGIELTEMWDAHDITDPMHEATWEHPELYSFCDISQNNHSPADRHWRNLLWLRQRILDSGHPRPINTVKIYGANTGPYGSHRDAQERFWRNILGGCASTRFHRPEAGLGLGEIPRAHIRSMRMFLEEIDIFRCRPAGDLLDRVSWNEAYCAADPPRGYGLFFCDGGDVDLDVSAAAGGELTVRWLDIRDSRWVSTETATVEAATLRLVTPREDGYWAAVVKPA